MGRITRRDALQRLLGSAWALGSLRPRLASAVEPLHAQGAAWWPCDPCTLCPGQADDMAFAMLAIARGGWGFDYQTLVREQLGKHQTHVFSFEVGRSLRSTHRDSATIRKAPSNEKALSLDRASICLARPAGFEPTTPWFVARYSIQLSYGREEQEL